MNTDIIIGVVQEYRDGALRRADSHTPGSATERFFRGKVDAYEDIISWLEYVERAEAELGVST